jgi:hypothetical protein
MLPVPPRQRSEGLLLTVRLEILRGFNYLEKTDHGGRAKR